MGGRGHLPILKGASFLTHPGPWPALPGGRGGHSYGDSVGRPWGTGVLESGEVPRVVGPRSTAALAGLVLCPASLLPLWPRWSSSMRVSLQSSLWLLPCAGFSELRRSPPTLAYPGHRLCFLQPPPLPSYLSPAPPPRLCAPESHISVCLAL